MGKQREHTVPYPQPVEDIEFWIRGMERSRNVLDQVDVKFMVRDILAAEYGARRPRYTLIRFLKAHR